MADLLEVVDGLYAAALEPERWPEALDSLAQAVGGIGTVMRPISSDRLPLTVASPLMAGAIFIAITVLSALFLGEQLTATRAAGMLLVLAGIALLARSA